MDYVANARLADRIAAVLPLAMDRLGRLNTGVENHCGLSTIQQQLLEYVYRNGPTSIGTLRQALRRAQSSVSELADRLEEKGLAVRSADKDRRKSRVKLTREGRAWVAERHRHQRQALVQVLQDLESDHAHDMLYHLQGILSLTDRMRLGVRGDFPGRRSPHLN